MQSCACIKPTYPVCLCMCQILIRYDVDFSYIEAYMVQHPECKKAMEKLPPIEFGSIRIRVECSDLLQVKCDAVVNSADPYLGDSSTYFLMWGFVSIGSLIL